MVVRLFFDVRRYSRFAGSAAISNASSGLQYVWVHFHAGSLACESGLPYLG